MQSELHVGENLVWSGVPDARRAAVAAIPETLLPGLLFGGVGLFVMIYEYAGSSTMPKTSSRSLSPILAALVMGLSFVITGLINLLRSLWIYWRRLNTSNGVTNQRVMVLSLRTTVRAIRDSLREADQTFSARRRIIGSVSAKGTSCSKVSSAEMDCVGRSGTTSLSSIPFGPARRAE